MRFMKPITTLIFTTALAFGVAQGQESDETTDTGAASADTAKPDRHYDGPPRRQMSEEERAERRAKWEAMSEEERQAAREKMRQHRGGKDRPHKDHPHKDHPRPDAAPEGV